jgi:hypothetical protein
MNEWVVAIHGVLVDPHPRRFADLYQRLHRRVSHMFSKAPFHGKVSRVMSNVHLPGSVATVLSKIRKKRQKRKRNNLGKVVSYSTQEVKSVLQPDNSEDKGVEDIEINENGPSDPVQALAYEVIRYLSEIERV